MKSARYPTHRTKALCYSIPVSSDSSRITSLQHLSPNRNTRPAVAQEPWIRNTAECLNHQTSDDFNILFIPYFPFSVNDYFSKFALFLFFLSPRFITMSRAGRKETLLRVAAFVVREESIWYNTKDFFT